MDMFCTRIEPLQRVLESILKIDGHETFEIVIDRSKRRIHS